MMHILSWLLISCSYFSTATNTPQMADAATDINCTQWWNEQPISDSFIISSTNVQTAFAIIQVCLLWTNVLGEYIFYKKPDDPEVQNLKNKLHLLRKEHKRLRKKEPRIGQVIFSDVVKYLRCENEGSIKDKNELLERVEFLRDLLDKRTKDEYSSDLESD